MLARLRMGVLLIKAWACAEVLCVGAWAWLLACLAKLTCLPADELRDMPWSWACSYMCSPSATCAH